MTHDPLLKYREQHKHRLNYMPWLYLTLNQKHRAWAEQWQNEYQQYLEQNWVDTLKKEFNVKVNNDVFEKVKKELK